MGRIGGRSGLATRRGTSTERRIGCDDGEDKFQSSNDEVNEATQVMTAEEVVAAPPHEFAGGAEEEIKKNRARPECVVFGAGKLWFDSMAAAR